MEVMEKEPERVEMRAAKTLMAMVTLPNRELSKKMSRDSTLRRLSELSEYSCLKWKIACWTRQESGSRDAFRKLGSCS
jgi:hypothetical protein